MIQRIREYGKKTPSRDAHIIYIVCEGRKTEPQYFQFFENRFSSNLKVIPIPSKNGETDPVKLMERAQKDFFGDKRKYTVNYKRGDTIWFVIDTDEWEKGKTGSKISILRKFCKNQNESIPKIFDEIKQYDAWNVAQSNPCFEIWLYYHFEENPPEDFEYTGKDSFKEYVDNAISGGFKPNIHPVFLKKAIKNASSNLKYDAKGKLCLYTTEVHLLGQEIYGFVKKSLDKLETKVDK